MPAVHLNTVITQGHSPISKVPFGPIFFEPVTPQQKLINLVRHRNICLKVMPIDYERNDRITYNVKASLIGCIQSVLRRS